jgi:uncharacterized protein YceH (UPF0502 family)
MNDTPQEESPRWQPLPRIDRRVVGVLVEKAKTTPDNYPLSLNGLVNGSNQKSNRSPQMQLDEEQVAEAIDRLRMIGAVSIIQGDGRVEKYRHLLYEWLGVDKAELAVMAELLLRGEQTLGDLRGRAARMEPIKGISELQPIVESLREKGLIQLLTPPGRGCVLTHTLYEEQELAKLRREFEGQADARRSATSESAHSSPSSPRPAATSNPGEMEALRAEVASLKQQLDEVREQVAEIDTLRIALEKLNQQLGV